MWGKTKRALLLAALTTLALAGTAQAKQIQQYFYSGEFFDAGGLSPAAIAVDSASQKLLVVGNSDKAKGLKISKFQFNGDPAGFSGRGEVASFNTGDALSSVPAVAIAIDESGTASDGNFYIAMDEPITGGKSQVYGYAPDGTPLPGFPVSVPGSCGVAVAPDGNLWIATPPLSAYVELTADGNPTDRVLFAGRGKASCRVAIDPVGNFYVGRGEHVAKYDSSFHFLSNLGPFAGALLVFDRADDTLLELFPHEVAQLDPTGNPITIFGGPDPTHFSYGGLANTRGLSVDPQTHKVYVLKGGAGDAGEIDVFSHDPITVTVPSVSAGGAEDLAGTSATLTGTLDPDGIDTTDCRFEWGTYVEGQGAVYSKTAPCAEGNVFAGGSGATPVTAAISGLKMGTVYHFRLSGTNANGIAGFSSDREFAAADSPLFGAMSASHVTTDTARIGFEVNTNGADTKYHVEIGPDTSYGSSFPIPDGLVSGYRSITNHEEIEAILTPQSRSQEVSGLSPETLYHYRVVAENPAGVTIGDDRTFRTFALPTSGADLCPNAQARQQTSAAGLLDCRAYELVSAPDTGGYDVRSDLVPGVSALSTSPQASGAALYSMRSGTIPGIAGHPTNRGADPYVATRGGSGWSTRYVGLEANNPFATGPFASPLSGFDSALETFSFGGAEICDPCFADGSTDVPLRLPDGSLVQGMAGSIDPPGPANPAGTVKEPLSADGSHFVFATTAQFEPTGNSNGTDATIYSRGLEAATTEVISTDDSGATLANGDGVAALAVSEDGLRTVIGEELATDASGNAYYHLYLHIAGTAESVDLMPGATEGALLGGMTEDGSKVFFTTSEPLGAGESDTSADIYEAEVSGPGVVAPKLLSSGSGGTGDTDLCSAPGDPDNWNAVSGDGKCNAVAFAGGAGLAVSDGTFYFLSPERLDGSFNGTQDQPNLYVVEPGASTPDFVATIDSSLAKPPPAPPTRPVVTTEFGGFHSGPAALAVDQSNGDVYVAEGDSSRISRYTSAGAPKEFTEGPGEGTNTIPGLSFVELAAGVAVDSSGGILDGNIYVTNYPNVSIFSQTGQPLGQLTGIGEVCGVAVDQSNGDVYVGDCTGKIRRYSPTSATLPISNANYTVTGISTGTESAAVAADNGNIYGSSWPSGPVRQYSASQFEAGLPSVSGTLLDAKGTALSANPATHEVYVDEGNRIVTFNAAGEQQLTLGAGELSGSRGVAVNANSNHVYAPQSSGTITEFGFALTPYEPIDNPAIIHAVKQAGTHDSSDFEVTPDGKYAAFASLLPLDGYDNAGRYEVFRYGTEGSAGPACVSCSVTTARPASDASLTPYGLSLLEDGRVFFTTGEQLTLRDSNEKLDAYEWKDGKQELISTGTSPTDSKLLSASSDGTDVFFFARQKLVPEDQNGSNVRLYTAREEGGFAFGPPQFQCAASDECHGASTAPAPPLTAGTTAGAPGQFAEERQIKCHKGTVKRRGRCVKRHPHKRRQHKRAASTRQGGGK